MVDQRHLVVGRVVAQLLVVVFGVRDLIAHLHRQVVGKVHDTVPLTTLNTPNARQRTRHHVEAAGTFVVFGKTLVLKGHIIGRKLELSTRHEAGVDRFDDVLGIVCPCN